MLVMTLKISFCKVSVVNQLRVVYGLFGIEPVGSILGSEWQSVKENEPAGKNTNQTSDYNVMNMVIAVIVSRASTKTGEYQMHSQ